MIRKIKYLVRELIASPEQSRLKPAEILFFLKFVTPLWKIGLIVMLLTAAATLIGALIPLSGKILIDFVILKKPMASLAKALEYVGLSALVPQITGLFSSLEAVIFLLLLAGLAIGLISVLQRLATLRFQQEITFNLQTSLFDRLLRFPLFLIKEKQVGYLMSRVTTDVAYIQIFFSNVLPQFATGIFSVLFCLAILSALNTVVFLIMLGLIPIWILINMFFGSRIRAISITEMERQAQISKDMQEVIAGVEVIKSQTAEKQEVLRISNKIRKLFQTRIRSTLYAAVAENLMKTVKLAAILFISWFSVRQIEQGKMTIGDMTALIAYLVYLAGRAAMLSSAWLMLQRVFASMERLMEMFNILPEFDEQQPDQNCIIPDTIQGEIRFANVNFFYEAEKPILSNVSFAIRPGESMALVGPSGVGKTTLINLLLKFLTPQSGAIFLDDRDIRGIDTQWLRKQIGFVSQDIFLFNTTIADNIRYGNPDASLEQVAAAANSAGIHQDINAMPLGYDTIVGERGVNLSTGQRQRISIARAFLKNPPILIFDEPTSALDQKTEQELNTAIEKLGANRTLLIITHRSSVAAVASRIFSMSDPNGRQSCLLTIDNSPSAFTRSNCLPLDPQQQKQQPIIA